MPGPYGSTGLKICLDLELICRGGFLDFQMLMVKVKFYALAVVGVAGQAQQPVSYTHLIKSIAHKEYIYICKSACAPIPHGKNSAKILL